MMNSFTLEMLVGLNEHMGFMLMDQEGEWLGIYDGRNSIDKKYNDCQVIYVKPLAENQMRIDVYVK